MNFRLKQGPDVHFGFLRQSAMVLTTLLLSLLLPVEAPAQGVAPEYENLTVLPKDISEAELFEIMLENLRGLGLPRLAGRGCLHCHDGDLETPRTEWNYASDVKPAKATARVMMAMVRDINHRFLGNLEGRSESSMTVSCATCHAGRLDPRPLPDVLWSTYESKGAEATIKKLSELRARYFGSDAYDFRSHVVGSVTVRMADAGSIQDAILLASANAQSNSDSGARTRLAALKLEQVIDEFGVEKALEALDSMESSTLAGVSRINLLDGLAWRLIRSERKPQGQALIEATYRKFPKVYGAVENMVFVLLDQEQREQGIALLQEWIDAHPNHDRARQLLINTQKD